MNSTKISKGLAEFYGAMIGDGCLSKYFSNYDKKEKFCVLLTGHTHDEPYYRKTIRPIFQKEFGINGCIRFKKKDNVVRFETISKRIFLFFVNLGFPVGLKGNLSIPNQIMEDETLALCCVRGIFDTDGSVYNRYSKKYANHSKKYNYKNIEIKMIARTTIEQIKIILENHNIKTSKIRIHKNSYVLNIHNQDSIKQFFEEVKPSNKYHTERYLNR